jgi:hypothetical protein
VIPYTCKLYGYAVKIYFRGKFTMKKAYEAPSVKITVFTASEDILVGSDVIIDTGDLFGTV